MYIVFLPYGHSNRWNLNSAALVTVVDTVWVWSLFLLHTFLCCLFLTQELVTNRITSQFSVLPAAGLGLLVSWVTAGLAGVSGDYRGSSKQ